MPNKQPNDNTSPQDTRFTFAAPAQFSLEASAMGKSSRKFNGVAYSGEVIKNHYCWGDVIFDLSSMTVPERLPVLIDHNSAQRCGFTAQMSVTNEQGLTVAGVLLSNDFGQQVAQDSDEGFPWQMSVHIEPGTIEQVGAGTSVAINGKSLMGPLTVFKNSRILEVSFTAVGYDGNTRATALSKPLTEKDCVMTPESFAALQAENTSLKERNATLLQERDKAVENLNQFSVQERQGAIQRLFAEIGRSYSQEDADTQAFAAMPAASFVAAAKVLREQFKAPPSRVTPEPLSTLFQHRATNGAKDAPASSTCAANPLMADAQKRATQFNQRV